MFPATVSESLEAIIKDSIGKNLFSSLGTQSSSEVRRRRNVCVESFGRICKEKAQKTLSTNLYL
jgi:hypothetical protein